MTPSELELVKSVAAECDITVEALLSGKGPARVREARAKVARVLVKHGHSFAAAGRVVGLHWKTVSNLARQWVNA